MRSKKAIANIITELGVQFINIICAFIIPKLIISTYGSDINGLVTSISKLLAHITLLESGFGVVIKSVLYKSIANKDKFEIEKILKASEKIFRKISYIFIIYIVVLCVVLPIYLKDEFEALIVISLIIIISIYTFAEYYFEITYRLYLQAEQKKYVVSIIQIVTSILSTIIIILLINIKCNIQIVKIASALVFILRPILQKIYVKKIDNISLKNVDSVYKIKQKWDGLAQHIAYVIHTNTDIVILLVFTNLREVSVYSVYTMIIAGIKSVIQAFTNGIDATFGNMIANNEKDKLNKSFNLYERFYLTISTIVFSSALFLIVPFVRIYTNDITDVDYIRPVFAYLIICGEFIYIINQLYYSIVKVAGLFKQTKMGAWMEAILNVLISLSLTWKFGLIGVAIGTLVATSVRTVEIMYYTSKYVLNRKVLCTFKRIIGVIFELIIITVFINVIHLPQVNSYANWIMHAIIVTSISGIVTILVNRFIWQAT